jgi:[acyl-carrier-protein] S-malonyltransferase
MGLALLFPGQGAQHPGMLPWLWTQPEAAPLLDRLEALLDAGWRERLRDPAWASANAVAQPLLTGIGLAAWRVLAARLPTPVVVAGYSVGELPAFAVAGAIGEDLALTLAVERAALMDQAVAGQDTGLMSVQGQGALGLASAAVVRATPGLSIAIRIDESRVIVGGPAALLDAHAARWREEGLRCARLPVAVASHTPLMASAATGFAHRLADLGLNAPRVSVVCGFNAAATRNPGALAAALAGQIASTIRWDEVMDSVAERGVSCVLEVGPGAALAGMWRERHPRIPVRSIDEFQGPEGVSAWVRGQMA